MSPGAQLPELVRGPIDRATLALFAGASHDHVRLHIDSDFAKAAGMEDVFAHGMLTMAYLAQAIRTWVSQDRLRSWQVRFLAIVPLHSTIRCRGTVEDVFHFAGERLANIACSAVIDDGTVVVRGTAMVALD